MIQSFSAYQGSNMASDLGNQLQPNLQNQNKPSEKDLRKIIILIILSVLLAIVLIVVIANYKYNFLPFNFGFVNSNVVSNEPDIDSSIEESDYLFAKLNIVEKANDKFALVSVSSNFTKVEEIVNNEISYYYPIVNFPPIISPDKKYVYVNKLGIVNLETKEIIENKVSKSSAKSCVWYSDSKKLACIGAEDGSDRRIKYRISDLLITGKEVTHEEKILSLDTVLEKTPDGKTQAVYKEEPNNFFRNSFGPVGVRGDNEIILFSGSHQGVGKYNVSTKKFSWIYRPTQYESDGPKAPTRVYSKVNDKLFYVNKLDGGFEIKDYSVRYSANLVEVDIKTGQAKEVWTGAGDHSIGNLYLSSDESKVVFKVIDNSSRSINFYIVNTSGYDEKPTPFDYDFDTNIEPPKLLGFTNNGNGLVAFQITALSDFSATNQSKLSLKYAVNRYENGKIVPIIEEVCESDFDTKQKRGDCAIYVMAL